MNNLFNILFDSIATDARNSTVSKLLPSKDLTGFDIVSHKVLTTDPVFTDLFDFVWDVDDLIDIIINPDDNTLTVDDINLGIDAINNLITDFISIVTRNPKLILDTAGGGSLAGIVLLFSDIKVAFVNASKGAIDWKDSL